MIYRLGPLSCFMAAGLLFAGPAPAADWIAFVRPASDGHEVALYRNNAVTPLAACAADTRPVWSSDGRRLAFAGPDLALVWYDFQDADAPVAHRPEPPARVMRHPAWSAQGALLACEAYDTYPFESRLMVLDTRTGAWEAWGGGRTGLMAPSWLPTPRMLFAIDPSQDLQVPGLDLDLLRAETGLASGEALEGVTRALFAITLYGEPGNLSTELVLVTQSLLLPVLQVVPQLGESERFDEWRPVSSPGGSRLIYESNDGGDRELYHVDERGRANITNHRAADWNPVWASDGRTIAFESFRGGRRGVYALKVETVRTQPIAVSETSDFWDPSWDPDSERVACVTGSRGATRIVVIDADSGDDVTPGALRETGGWAPAWRPEP